MDTEKPDFDHAVRQLIQNIRHHVSDEENDLLPRMRTACSANQLQDLGNKIRMAKKSAPTRPRPMAPDTPPANLVLDRGGAGGSPARRAFRTAALTLEPARYDPRVPEWRGHSGGW